MLILGAGILGIILVAGLWPFHAPSNEVTWLENEAGIRFSRYGSVVSSGAFHNAALRTNSEGSVEIWLEPSDPRSQRTILSFDGSDHPGAPFSLHQYKGGLVVHRYNVDEHGTARTAWITVDSVFREQGPVLVSIVLDKQSTSVYLGGVLAKVSPILGVSTNNLTGRLVVANSPRANDSWSGLIRGLAIYQRQLTPGEVAQHYASWTKKRRPPLGRDEDPLALYLFNEDQGRVVHNEIDPANSLILPERYFVLHPGLLVSPQRDYHSTWSYWEDVAVNIAGFIPLGGWVFAYCSSVRRVKSPAALTIFVGFSISFVIEVLQAFLPTRTSGMTDIITNTLGTVIGVMFCQLPVIRGWLTTAQRRSKHLVTTESELETALSA